ncbi:TPA: hypothetical protein ACSP0N_002161, partial [Aeromonas veronii]
MLAPFYDFYTNNRDGNFLFNFIFPENYLSWGVWKALLSDSPFILSRNFLRYDVTMNAHISHVLMLLEDVGLKLSYPNISKVKLNKDGSQNVHLDFFFGMGGSRVTIEQNPTLKLLVLFSVFDLFVDQLYPNLAGKSFSAKYKSLPENNECQQVFKSLFRVAKVMRNALIHNSSALSFQEKHLSISYDFNQTNFKIKLTYQALDCFFTALVMYLKQNLGTPAYFQGIMNTLYSDMVSEIDDFNDEFGKLLFIPTGLRLLRRARNRVYFDCFELKENRIILPQYESDYPDWRGVDYCLSI